MSVVDLARHQFAGTAGVHFLFVALTLGLVTLVAVTQTRWVVGGKPELERMTRFFGLLYVINYAVGIATGLVMEFQFGLAWSGLSHLVGDVFGGPLALETLLAFVLESTLLGMWIFGWGRLRKGVHLALIWGVVLTAYLSAFWVLVANAFLQNPVGYEMVGDRARLTDFGALLANPTLWFTFGHVMAAAFLVGGLFMAGVSAWHLRRGNHVDGFRRSLNLGLWTATGASVLTIGFGFAQFSYLTDLQPSKLGGADRHAELAARFGPGEWLPPSVAAPLEIMIQIGFWLFLISGGLLLLATGGALHRARLLRPVLIAVPYLIAVPFLATLLGWVVRETGRQPWAVYGLLRTEDAVSDLPPAAMWTSLIGFSLLVGVLAIVDWWLLARYARRGPGDEFRQPVETSTVDARPFAAVAREAV